LPASLLFARNESFSIAAEQSAAYPIPAPRTYHWVRICSWYIGMGKIHGSGTNRKTIARTTYVANEIAAMAGNSRTRPRAIARPSSQPTISTPYQYFDCGYVNIVETYVGSAGRMVNAGSR